VVTVPEPLKSVVLVVLTAVPPALVVVVVLLVCAKAVAATTQAMPVANIFINLVCFIFVFALVIWMLSVVNLSDSIQREFIQPHLYFVNSGPDGCMQMKDWSTRNWS